MKRAPEIGAVALLLATLVVWMAALVTARPPRMPSVAQVMIPPPIMPTTKLPIIPRSYCFSAAPTTLPPTAPAIS